MPSAMKPVSATFAFTVAAIGIATYSTMDVLMKGLSIASGAYSAVLWRSVVGVALLGTVFVLRRRPWPGRAALRLHVLRGATAGVSVLLFFWGLARVPMAQGVALTFLAPLIALYFAAALLGETIRRGAILDVAQALGAGYSYSDGAGAIAAIVKLTRVALLAPVLAVVAMGLARWGGGGEGHAKGPGVPWFVIGFFVLAGINSFGVIPAVVATGAERVAAAMLAAAVTATAIRSPLSQLLEAGPKPLLVILAATLVAFGLALAAALLLIG